MRVAPAGWYRYDLVWHKTTPTGFLNAKKAPLRNHELILIFSPMPLGKHTYNPQKTYGHVRKVSKASSKVGCKETELYGKAGLTTYDSTERYPLSVMTFKTDRQKSAIHPNQKPVELLRYLIRTYTNPGKLKLYVFEAIKNYAPDDILIISNQGGIEKGFVDKEMFEYKFDYISNALEDYTDISVSAYYCESNNKRNVNRKPNIGMIKEYMDFIEYMNNDEDEEEKIVYDTILMIGDASGKEGQFSDSDKKTAENFGCEYMDVDDFVYKYKG